MKKEYTQLVESIDNTQKLVRTWVSQGFSVEIIYQTLIPTSETNGVPHLFTSLWRYKKEN